MTWFGFSYALLWVLAALLVPACAVLLHLLAYLRRQVGRESASGIQGEWLVGRSIADLPCKEVSTQIVRKLNEYLGTKNVVLCLSPECGTCKVMLRELLSYSREFLGEFNFIALCMSPIGHCQSMVSSSSSVQDVPILAYEDMTDTEFFTVRWPAFVVVNAEGKVIDVRHPPTVKAMMNRIKSGVYESPDSEKRASTMDATVNGRTNVSTSW